MRGVFLFIISLFLCQHSFSQQSAIDSLKNKYSFLNIEALPIVNGQKALSNFYKKLQLQEENKDEVVNVCHIGDSHIQADFFSGKMRRNLQKKFGNAGRGLVFPYRVAKTNEPWGMRSEATGVWESKRCVFYEKPLPIGVSGITLKCTDSLSEVSVNILDQEGLDYRFNKFTLFHQKGNDCYDLLVMDQANNIRGFINANLLKPNTFSSMVLLDSLTRYVKLKSYKRDSSLQQITQIYGLYLENGLPGIIYNMIGVNGAEYPHYNKAALFQEQLKALNNRLIIISLGTNDLIPPNPDINKLISQIDTMVTAIKLNNPETDILITGSGDFLRKRKIKNKNIELLNNKLEVYCLQKNIAFWNWYKIMGGLGSVTHFQKRGLAQADKLHLTRAGYELQADLLYYALLNDYQAYLNNKP